MKACVLCEFEPEWYQSHKLHEHHAWGYSEGAKTIPVCASCHRRIHHRIDKGQDMTPGSYDYQNLYQEIKPIRDKYRHRKQLDEEVRGTT